MKSRALAALSIAAAALSLAAPADAGTVYVPLPGVTSAGNQPYKTQIVVSNELASARSAKGTFLALDSDGTSRAGLVPTTISVLGKRAAIFEPSASASGLLEIDGPRDFQYSARLVGLGSVDGQGVALPVINSENQSAAGSVLFVHGLRSNVAGTLGSTLGVVNLEQQSSSCTIAVIRADGVAAVAPATVTLKPLSSRLFATGAGSDLLEARAKVSCNRAFFAYGIVADSASGDLSTLWPATSGESSLAPPGALPECAATAICFEALGIIHKPTPSNPVKRVSFAAPAVDAKRLRLTLEVTVDDWFPADPDAKHLIYWFVINKNLDMPGMLYFRGPDAYTALVRHGIGLTHPLKKKLVDLKFEAQVGTTYRVVNDYDMAADRYEVTITDVATGQVRSRIQSSPNVTHYQLKPTDKLIVDMGFPEGVTFDEVPSYKWTYQNLRIEVFK